LNWKAGLALVIASLTLSARVGLAAELPQRFLGTWMLEDTMRPGNPERCTRADWKPGYQVNDRVVMVDRKRLSPIEGGCRIISAKEASLPNPRYPQITPPVTVELMCAAEGDEKETPVTSVWSIHSIGGRTIMVHVDAKDPTKIDVYQKCS
jgi:hypothetical protein